MAESMGQQNGRENEYFKLKKIDILLTSDFKFLSQIVVNSIMTDI